MSRINLNHWTSNPVNWPTTIAEFCSFDPERAVIDLGLPRMSEVGKPKTKITIKPNMEPVPPKITEPLPEAVPVEEPLVKEPA